MTGYESFVLDISRTTAHSVKIWSTLSGAEWSCWDQTDGWPVNQQWEQSTGRRNRSTGDRLDSKCAPRRQCAKKIYWQSFIIDQVVFNCYDRQTSWKRVIHPFHLITLLGFCFQANSLKGQGAECFEWPFSFIWLLLPFRSLSNKGSPSLPCQHSNFS